MRVNELLPGFKVDIKYIQQINRGEDMPSSYMTSIYDVTSDGSILLYLPTSAGKNVILPLNIRYEFIFSTANGMYRAEGIVTRHAKKEGFFLLIVKLTSTLEKYQRRQYYRLDVTNPVVFTSITKAISELPGPVAIEAAIYSLNFYKVRGMGTITNISGGGMRFVTSTELPESDYVYLLFQLDLETEKKQMELVAHIVDRGYKKESSKFEYRCEFLYKEANSREAIIKYIFDEERRLRNRGK